MHGIKLFLFQPPFLILILSLSSFRHHSPGSHCGCLECFQGRVQVGHRPEVVKLATQLNTIGANAKDNFFTVKLWTMAHLEW